MEEKIFKYQFSDKTYIQKKLVLGQINQLIHFFRENNITILNEVTVQGVVISLGDKIPHALAIVLTEEGKSPKGKDLKALAEEIEFGISPETTLEVVEHFFDCNHIPSLLEKLTGMMGKITEKISLIGSKTSSVSSPEETLQKEPQSSGDILQTSASPILNLESGK